MPLEIKRIRDIKGSAYEFKGYLRGFPSEREAELLSLNIDEDVEIPVVIDIEVDFDAEGECYPQVVEITVSEEISSNSILNAISPIAVEALEYELSRDWSLIAAWGEDRICAAADSLYDSIEDR